MSEFFYLSLISSLRSSITSVLSAWVPGYLLGSPIAVSSRLSLAILFSSLIFRFLQGYLIKDDVPTGDYAAYRPAIFYAGALSCVSAVLVLVVRLQLSRKVFKRM